jgi:hypothetical protein
MNEHREALIPAIVRILMRYGVGAGLGMTFSNDPDVILVVTILVGLMVEGWYARDWVKRGPQ